MNLNDLDPQATQQNLIELTQKVAGLEKQVASLLDVVAILLADGNDPLVNRIGEYPHLNAGVVNRAEILADAKTYLASRHS